MDKCDDYAMGACVFDRQVISDEIVKVENRAITVKK